MISKRSSLVKVGLIGFGYWGSILLRNLSRTKECSIIAVSDRDPVKLESVKRLYPYIKFTTDYRNILHDSNVQGVIIATPAGTHFEIAYESLNAGKDVLVEKPLSTTVADAVKLQIVAKEQKNILMVDHTFVYSKAIEKIYEAVNQGQLGKIVGIDSTRASLGIYQNDINVIGDLAVHDFSIFDYITKRLPKSVFAIGAKHINAQQEDQAYIHAWYPDNLLVNINVSWLSPIKIRKMIISGTKNMVVYDDIEPTEKVKIYDTGVDLKTAEDSNKVFEQRFGYRRGDIFSPYIEVQETLALVCEEFIKCIKTRTLPKSDGESGVRVVRVMAAALESLKTGKIIRIGNDEN